MTYIVDHKLVFIKFDVPVRVQNGKIVLSCAAEGELPPVRHPGRLIIKQNARYTRRIYIGDLPDEVDTPSRGTWNTESTLLHLDVEIFTPDGLLFTPDHVTLEDLRRFRDLRGCSHGVWRYRMRGWKEYVVDPDAYRIEGGRGSLNIRLEESVYSKSAPPLVDVQMRSRKRKFNFDLYRVGEFVADAWRWRRSRTGRHKVGVKKTLRLLDPDGNQVASGVSKLRHPITLPMLDKSRDAAGAVRPWTFEVTGGGPALLQPFSVHATVRGQIRIAKGVIEDRIAKLLGPNGENVTITAEIDEQGSENQVAVRLRINDEVLAETLNIYKFLKNRLNDVDQEADVDADAIETGKLYTLFRRSRDFPAEAHLSLYDDPRVTSIKVSLVNAQHGSRSVHPALRFEVGVQGEARIKIGGFPVASARIYDNRIVLEASLSSLTRELWQSGFGWMAPASPINVIDLATTNMPVLDTFFGRIVDLQTTAIADIVLGVATLGVGTALAQTLISVVEAFANVIIPVETAKLVHNFMEKTPRLLAAFNGDHFTFGDVRLEGDDLVFDYIAPTEIEPKPSEGYTPILGRAIRGETADGWRLRPPSLGDTWAADNLAKIDHIVVVMMENRSFDHVLGYRAQLPGAVSDGLTQELIEFIERMPQVEGLPEFKLPYLGDPDCKIPPNALGLKTKFPRKVGHKLKNVSKQLSERIEGPGARWINSPKGFLEDFEWKDDDDFDRVDVLGYYAGRDLPFYQFLAENYGYSERYFCSHPGPTLPNRMYWLTGDVQYDRTGEAILDNSRGDNIALSRMPSIADVLTRKSVSWRFYESFPSVTMLRMFARYAGDNTNIRPYDEFAKHVAEGNLPAVTIVEPAMHHGPMNDDHPIADMYDGQLFVKGVYDTLRRNGALWAKTMMIVVYDEHGAFYDHVIPPWADGRAHRPTLAQDPFVPGPGGASTNPLLAVPYGVRVPAFVISPFTPAGKGPDIVLDHCSILKTVLARFCPHSRPFMSDRVQHSRSFDAFLSAAEPRLDVPPPPVLGWPHRPDPEPPRPHGSFDTRIITEPLSARDIEDDNAAYHELTGHFARLLGR